MKRTLSLLILLCGCASLPDGLHVTRSLTDKNTASKPAQLQVTAPKDADRSYAVDFGLGYTRSWSQKDNLQTDLVYGAEYHRNTLTDKKQDSTLVTLGIDQIIGNITPDKGPKADPVWLPSFAAKFKKDRIKSTESFLPTIIVTLASKRLRIGEVIGSTPGFLWQPTAALEWERITRAANHGPTGSTARAWASLDVDIYPLFTKLGSQLDLSLTARAWHDVHQSAVLRTGGSNQYLRKASLTYFIDKDQHFGVGVDRVSGENPSEGQPDQHYTQLTLKLKL